MVNLLESMHKCCLSSGVPSESTKASVQKIFGGRLCSQVKCMQCSYCSNKLDPFLDLSLEIANVDSILSIKPSITSLLWTVRWRGEAVSVPKMQAESLKQLTVYKAPYVLTVHLKRFGAHDPGQKIDRKVQFGPALDMKPFVSGSYEGDLKYTLYGVLVHHGWSTHSGHYYCFVRTSSGLWYSLDDNQVVQVNERSVLEQKAYMLFYVRDRKNGVPRKPVVVSKENLKENVNGNKTCSIVSQPPKEHPQSCPNQNGVYGADSSIAARQNAAVDDGSSKEFHLKHPSMQTGQVLVECSVPNKDTLSEPAYRAPSLKNPSERLTVPNTDQGKSSQPSMSRVNCNSISHHTENNATATAAYVNNSKENGSSKNDLEVSLTTLPNCNWTQTSASKLVNEPSQKINVVSKAGASIVTPRDSKDKKMEGISMMPLSGDSNDKRLEKTCPIKLQNEKVEDNGLAMELGSVESSTALMLKKEILHVKSDSGPKRKLKKLTNCQIRNMAIGLQIFRASLGLRKKHKRSKRRILDSKNFSKELYSERDCSSSDVGPSNSDSTSRIPSSSHSRKKAANSTARKNVKPRNGDSSMNSIAV